MYISDSSLHFHKFLGGNSANPQFPKNVPGIRPQSMQIILKNVHVVRSEYFTQCMAEPAKNLKTCQHANREMKQTNEGKLFQ